MLFYISALFIAYRSASRVYSQTKRNPELADISSMALTIMIALVGFFVVTFFLAFGYRVYQPTIIGFLTAFGTVAPAEIRARTERAALLQPRIRTGIANIGSRPFRRRANPWEPPG
jgi:hypothetical protein